MSVTLLSFTLNNQIPIDCVLSFSFTTINFTLYLVWNKEHHYKPSDFRKTAFQNTAQKRWWMWILCGWCGLCLHLVLESPQSNHHGQFQPHTPGISMHLHMCVKRQLLISLPHLYTHVKHVSDFHLLVAHFFTCSSTKVAPHQPEKKKKKKPKNISPVCRKLKDTKLDEWMENGQTQ